MFEIPPFLTADDWGLSPEINDAILELARRKIIARVSIMVRQVSVTYKLKDLLEIPNITHGLHFDLTSTQQKRPLPLLFEWLFSWGARRKKLKDEVRQELRSQLEKAETLGIKISYFDSHEH